jgi:RHS repeat-associated protein
MGLPSPCRAPFPTQVIDSLSGTIARTYDNFDRLTSETTPQGSVSYLYDDAGRRTSMTVVGQLPVTSTYDEVNRLTQITQGAASVSYTYDAAHRRMTATLPNGVLVTSGYDAASQLTSLTYTHGATTLGTLTYVYDDAGNRMQVGGTWARTGLPQLQGGFVYNAANRLTNLDGAQISSDDHGNLIQGKKQGQTLFDYTWDARNQLVGLTKNGVSGSFAYDGLGRRISKTVIGATTEFVYDGLNPVQELSGGSVVANLLTGLGLDEFVTRTEGGSSSTFLTDALGSTVALTDGTGTVHTEYTYEPFGAGTVSGTGSSNAYQFTGRETDGTGLLFYRARYYSPSLQRFISEDPIEFTGGMLICMRMSLTARRILRIRRGSWLHKP